MVIQAAHGNDPAHEGGCAQPGPKKAGPSSSGRRKRHQLDAVDRQLVELLRANGRMSNAALAAATSTAESTSHARVQALRQSGVITGFHAEVDPTALGRPLQALVFVRLHPGAREELMPQIDRLAKLPGVLNVFFLGGHHDYVIWVAMSSPAELRDFVVRDLSEHRAIAGTETSIILESHRGENLTDCD